MRNTASFSGEKGPAPCEDCMRGSRGGHIGAQFEKCKILKQAEQQQRAKRVCIWVSAIVLECDAGCGD